MSLSLESTPTPALLPASVSAPADCATALPYHRPGAPPAEPLPSELLQHAMRYISVAKDAVADASIIASIGGSGSRLIAFALTTSSVGTLLVGAPPAGRLPSERLLQNNRVGRALFSAPPPHELSTPQARRQGSGSAHAYRCRIFQRECCRRSPPLHPPSALAASHACRFHSLEGARQNQTTPL